MIISKENLIRFMNNNKIERMVIKDIDRCVRDEDDVRVNLGIVEGALSIYPREYRESYTMTIQFTTYSEEDERRCSTEK